MRRGPSYHLISLIVFALSRRKRANEEHQKKKRKSIEGASEVSARMSYVCVCDV